MYCSRSTNNKISKLHERALRIVYDDYNSKFEEILTKDGSFTIHHIYHGFSKASFLDLFHNYIYNFYSLRSQPNFQIARINITLKGSESVRYFRPIISNNIPIKIRSIQNVDTFKTEITNWKLKSC